MADELDAVLLEKVDLARRAALRKLVLGAAYAMPVVASFAMSGLATAGAVCYSSNISTPNTVVPCPVEVPTLTDQALPVFGAALGIAAVALVAHKTSEA
jgi:hypothetical protein